MSGSYQEALDYLYGFVNFEHRRLDQYSPEKFSLDRVAEFLARLGDPQESFPSIHIAGTKGKGSVAAMGAACLRASGYRTALYTSPHLQDFRDRIRILSPSDGSGRIKPDEVIELVERIKPVTKEVPGLTWYELVTAIAFLYFADNEVDVAVVEVGLGGRLDASNVLTPLVSVITSLSLDHTYLLGDTLAEIAIEKGGIIKPGLPVVSSPQKPEALAELQRIANDKGAPLILAGRDWIAESKGKKLRHHQPAEEWHQEIRIMYQQENALVALATLDLISDSFSGLTLESVRVGLATVDWPGRMQLLVHGSGKPTLLVDCAHNVDSARKLVLTIKKDFEFDRLFFILGMTADKDVKGILNMFLPLSDYTMLTSSGHPRASDPGGLFKLSTELGFETQTYSDVSKAVQAAFRMSTESDLICVTGSIFLVGDLLNQWEVLQSRLWDER
jgi:dihydrofolate synthase/folylpolyglutamate synthase